MEILAQIKRTLKKKDDKNCLHEDDVGNKCFAETYMFNKKMFAEENFSYVYPPPEK